MRTTLRTPWTRQPQVLAQLNPVYRAIGAYTPVTGGALNQAKKYPLLAPANAPTVGAGPAGLQWNLNGSSQYFSANLGAPQLEGFTIIAIGTPTNVAGNNAIATIADTVLAQGSYGLRINAGVVGAYAYSTAGAFNESTHAVSAVVNQTYVFGAVFASTASRTVYLNGTPGTPNTTSGAVTSASQFSIGVLNRSGITQFWPGGVSGVFVLPWALTDAEMARMRTPADVYAAMYAPLQRTLWVPAAAGGGTVYTMSPGGTITFSGNSNQLRTRTQVPSGSIVFSGTAPNLRTRLQTTSGSIVFSGTAPFSNSATYTMSPGGTITFSGTSIQNHERVQSITGNITFSGTSTMLRTRTIVPTGAIEFSGTTPEIRVRVQVPTGQITFLGSAPLINPNAVGGVTTWRTLTGSGN